MQKKSIFYHWKSSKKSAQPYLTAVLVVGKDEARVEGRAELVRHVQHEAAAVHVPRLLGGGGGGGGGEGEEEEEKEVVGGQEEEAELHGDDAVVDQSCGHLYFFTNKKWFFYHVNNLFLY